MHLPVLDVDDGVDHLGDHPEFDAAHQPLEGVDGAGRVDDADHPDAREPHVREGAEVGGLAHLVVDGVVRPDHEQRVGRLLHRPGEFGVLGDVGADLQVTRLLHRLHREVAVREELRDGLRERRLPRAGRPGDEDASLVFGDAVAEVVGELVVVEVRLHDGADHRHLDAVREGGPGDRDAHIAELDDAHPGLLEFDEPLRGGASLRHHVVGVLRHLALGEFGVADGLVVHIADVAAFRHRPHPRLQVDRHRRLVEETLDGEPAGVLGLGFDVLDRDARGLRHLRLHHVARQQRRVVFRGEVADERVYVAFARSLRLARVRPATDVLEGERPLVGEFDESLELFEPRPAGVTAVVGLRLEFGDDGLGDVHRPPLVVPLGHAAVDDRARVR